ncbi:MAG: hypothetical protein WCR36_10055 [Bacteroidaceae bacterium]
MKYYLKKISQQASLYIRKHSPATHITTTSAEHMGRCKNYYVEETSETERLLKQFYENEERVLEKHGLFVENGKKVYYK